MTVFAVLTVGGSISTMALGTGDRFDGRPAQEGDRQDATVGLGKGWC